jgi:peptide/nickel transport system permease protein
MTASRTLSAFRRVVRVVVVFFAVSTLIFSCLYVAPGSPEEAIVGPQSATPAVLAQVRKIYGLDAPVWVQYERFMKGVLTGDLGRSFQTGESVRTGIATRLAVTLPLAIGGFILAAILGVAGGVMASRRQGSPMDRGLIAMSVLTASAPTYATGMALLYIFGIWLGLFPVFDVSSHVDSAHLALPVLTLALAGAAPIMRITRLAMLAAQDRDDIAFARARGINERTIFIKYALRHASVLMVSACNVVLIFTLVGTAVVEVTFNLHGIGAYLIDSINLHDVPSVQGVALVVTACVVVANMCADILYHVIDPRIRHKPGS